MNILQTVEGQQLRQLTTEHGGRPWFKPGDTLRVNVRITEGERTRVQAYEGVCISRKGAGIHESFTVRKISFGEGVERVFPLHSPSIRSLDVIRRGRVRRAKLHYLRSRRGKAARIPEATNLRTKRRDQAEKAAQRERERTG